MCWLVASWQCHSTHVACHKMSHTRCYQLPPLLLLLLLPGQFIVCVLSLKYLQLQNLWLPHGQQKQHANQISPNSTVRKFIYSSLSLSLSLLRNLTLSGLGTLPHTRRALVLCPPENCTRLGSVGRRVASAMAETKRWVKSYCPCPGERGVNWLSIASLIRQLSLPHCLLWFMHSSENQSQSEICKLPRQQ